MIHFTKNIAAMNIHIVDLDIETLGDRLGEKEERGEITR